MDQLFRDLPGWMLMVVTFCLPVPALRRKQPLLIAAWFTIGLHQCAALVQCYVSLLPGGDLDAQGFHQGASDPSQYRAAEPYAKALGLVYQSLGRSQLLGCELSIVAYTLAILVFVKLMEWIGSERFAVPLVLLFGALPSGVIHCSVTLREAFQLLVMSLAIWCITGLGDARYRLQYYTGLGLSVSLLTLLHSGLAILAIALTLVAGLRSARANALLTMMIAVPLGIGLFLYQETIRDYLTGTSPAVRAISQGRLTTMVETYREGVNFSRTTYGGQLRASSPGAFLATFPSVFFNYMFAPLPWQASGLKDLYALMESWLRMLLCWGTLLNVLRAPPARRKRLLYLVTVFLMIEATWAVGTSNWGQAIRHRIVAYGILLLTGAEPYLKLAFPEPQPSGRAGTADSA